MDQLISKRKIRLTDVKKVLDDRQKEIRRLRERIAELEGLGGGGWRRYQVRAVARVAGRPRRKLSARAQSQLKLQGAYMGYVRRLTAAQKNDVRKLRQEKGWRKANSAAKRMAKG